MRAAAKRSGMAAHAFSLEAIAEKTQQAELRVGFDAVAEQRYANIVSSGKAISWADMRKYLEDLVAGKRTKRPVARKLTR